MQNKSLQEEVRQVLDGNVIDRNEIDRTFKALAKQYHVTVAEVFVIYYTVRAEKGRTKA